MSLVHPDGSEQLPLFGPGAEVLPDQIEHTIDEAVPSPGVAVSVPERAAALLLALQELSSASSSQGYQRALEVNPTVRQRARGGPVAAMARARRKESASMLSARAKVISASGYAAMAEAELIDPDTAETAALDAWAEFRDVYSGAQNATSRNKYKAQLKRTK